MKIEKIASILRLAQLSKRGQEWIEKKPSQTKARIAIIMMIVFLTLTIFQMARVVNKLFF